MFKIVFLCDAFRSSLFFKSWHSMHTERRRPMMNTNETFLNNTSYAYNGVTRLQDELLQNDPIGIVQTKHATARIKQRGIKNSWINLILEYGDESFQSSNKSISISLGKNGVKKIKQLYGNKFNLNKLRRLYLVLTHDDVLITCAYR